MWGINYPDDQKLRDHLANEIAKIQSDPARVKTVRRSEKWNEYVAEVVARLTKNKNV